MNLQKFSSCIWQEKLVWRHASVPQLGAHFKLAEQPSPILFQSTIARQKQINPAFQLFGHMLDVQKTSLLVVYQGASDVNEQSICHCAQLLSELTLHNDFRVGDCCLFSCPCSIFTSAYHLALLWNGAVFLLEFKGKKDASFIMVGWFPLCAPSTTTTRNCKPPQKT
jgi:hypothetical protein